MAPGEGQAQGRGRGGAKRGRGGKKKEIPQTDWIPTFDTSGVLPPAGQLLDPQAHPESVTKLLQHILSLEFDKLTLQRKKAVVELLTKLYGSFENETVRDCLRNTVQLFLWAGLSERRTKLELAKAEEGGVEGLGKKVRALKKKLAKDPTVFHTERTFLPSLVESFFQELRESSKDKLNDYRNADQLPGTPKVRMAFCCKFVELISVLLSQIVTRRFLHCWLEENNLLARVQTSAIYSARCSDEFRVLVGLMKHFYCFPMDNYTGEEVRADRIGAEQHLKAVVLQRIAYKEFEELKEMAMAHTGIIYSRKALKPRLEVLSEDRLRQLCQRMGVCQDEPRPHEDKAFLVEALCAFHTASAPLSELVGGLSLLPTDELVFDEGDTPCFTMGVQYLSMRDYLCRNFFLHRIEASASIGSDISLAIKAIDPFFDHAAQVFRYNRLHKGKMALPITYFETKYVAPAKIGRVEPREVRGTITMDLGAIPQSPSAQMFRDDWDTIKQHDVIFLCSLSPKEGMGPNDVGHDLNSGPEHRFDIKVRGAEVVDIRDEAGTVWTGRAGDMAARLSGLKRTLNVELDPIQYHDDMTNKKASVYDSFNVVVRRDPKANNFKSILSSIQDLMRQDNLVPGWLHEPILGQGDPQAPPSLYDAMETEETHQGPVLPETEEMGAEGLEAKGKVEWTPQQLNAIATAEKPGLHLIVGPPGSGKTDVAVEVIHRLYTRNPEERILIVTHSNAGLNDIFAKITLRPGVDEKHLLRMGGGAKDLDTDVDFSKHGRLTHFLETQKAELERATEAGPLEQFNGVSSLTNRRVLGDYLLTQKSKILAMTCTYAALKRGELRALKFEFDTLVIEEAGQITEIETVIPISLQKYTEGEIGRLRRVVLIGDPNQLPPIVQANRLQGENGAGLDTSLFSRMIKLGVPHIQLDQQGRMRPCMADLFRWRYTSPPLEDMPHTREDRRFQLANAGFAHDWQFIDVPNGEESRPRAHFTQNWIEAHQVVYTYMYMRLLGYPRDKITVLTTYKGQLSLLIDVLRAWTVADSRLPGGDGVHGRYRKVIEAYKRVTQDDDIPHCSTVDRYQGQHNHYVLLSLVRSTDIGYLRDVRRLVVAVSRARLGLYMFGKFSVYDGKWQLKEVFDQIKKRPLQLSLVGQELYGKIDRLASEAPEKAATIQPCGGKDDLFGDQDNMFQLLKRFLQKAGELDA